MAKYSRKQTTSDKKRIKRITLSTKPLPFGTGAFSFDSQPFPLEEGEGPAKRERIDFIFILCTIPAKEISLILCTAIKHGCLADAERRHESASNSNKFPKGEKTNERIYI